MLLTIAFCDKDYLLAEKLLRWMAELDGQIVGHSLLLMASGGMNADRIKVVKEAAELAFRDVFSRQAKQIDERGWPKSCNTLFVTTYFEVKRLGEKSFQWIEPDCVPLTPGWLDEFESEYSQAGKPFMGQVFDYPVRHLNGCAIYPTDIERLNPQMLNPGAKPWDIVQPEAVLPHVYRTNKFQHVWGDRKNNIAPSFPTMESLSLIRSDAVLFHRCKDGTLIDRLRERRRDWKKQSGHQVVPQKIKVVLPFCQKDGPLMLENLKWQTELDGMKDFSCVLSVETGTSPSLVQRCFSEAGKSYSSVETFLYPHAPSKRWPNAPNWAFQHTARHMQRQNHPWFWMESDCIALQPGWLNAWNSRYFSVRKPILGFVIPGMGHCNGTAIYPANFPTLSRKAMTCSNTAWDGEMKQETIHLTADASDLMCHVWGITDGQAMICSGQPAVFRSQDNVGEWVNLKAVLFHRSKDTTLIERLRERRNERKLVAA